MNGSLSSNHTTPTRLDAPEDAQTALVDLPARVEAAMHEHTRLAVEELAASMRRSSEQARFMLRRAFDEINQIEEGTHE